MKTETIAHYITNAGADAVRVYKTSYENGKTIYRWNGKHETGCGELSHIKALISVMLTSKRNIRTVVAI